MFNYVTDQDTYVDIITCIEDSADITSDDTVKKVKYKQLQPQFQIWLWKQVKKYLVTIIFTILNISAWLTALFLSKQSKTSLHVGKVMKEFNSITKMEWRLSN